MGHRRHDMAYATFEELLAAAGAGTLGEAAVAA
jgi:hypothetical protein